jgi:hypothetical protein
MNMMRIMTQTKDLVNIAYLDLLSASTKQFHICVSAYVRRIMHSAEKYEYINVVLELDDVVNIRGFGS